MPMAPAMSPAFNCAAPSSVEIDCAVACVKLSGSAPHFSWLASSVAVVWVKLPVIWVLPPGMAPLIRGAETTFPSRVTATRLPTFGAVYLAHVDEPLELKSTLTTHSLVVDSVPAFADVICVPSMTAGPSRYFAVPSWEQLAM